jgi:hypothetical protein
MGPYDDEARKKEKEIAAAAAAAVKRGIDNNDGVPKPMKSRRKLFQETVLESDVVLAKENIKSSAIEDAAQETRSEVKEIVIRKNVAVLDDSDVFPGGSPVPDGKSRKSKSKAGKREKAALGAPDNAAVETALAPDKGDKKSKKSKKRKHAESLLVDDETTTPALDVTAEGQSPRKKKHKGNSKIIDPGQDKSLSEQALKGMFVSIELGLSEFILHYSSFLCLLPIRKSSRVEIQ